MSGWQEIETAPKDGSIVYLKSAKHMHMPAQCMAWDGARWAGLAFTPMGSREIYWDPEDPPTHWRAVQ
jgi:hypothetical protein